MDHSPQEFSFSLFKPEDSDSYKKSIIVLVHSFIRDSNTVTESRVKHELSMQHHIPKSDIKAALTALKSPQGFAALHAWKSRSTDRTLLRIRNSDIFDTWAGA